MFFWLALLHLSFVQRHFSRFKAHMYFTFYIIYICTHPGTNFLIFNILKLNDNLKSDFQYKKRHRVDIYVPTFSREERKIYTL